MSENLTKFIYTEGKKYRFTLKSEMRVRFPGRNFVNHIFCDGGGIERMRMEGDTIIVAPEYSWDGSSPKFQILGAWIGTPDFEGTRLASMIHDTLYQFLHLACFPLKRQDCDRIFGEVMKSNKFPLWWVYSGAVLNFGGIHHAIGSVLGEPRVGSCAVPII